MLPSRQKKTFIPSSRQNRKIHDHGAKKNTHPAILPEKLLYPASRQDCLSRYLAKKTPYPTIPPKKRAYPAIPTIENENVNGQKPLKIQ